LGGSPDARHCGFPGANPIDRRLRRGRLHPLSRLGTPLRPGPDGREWESGTEYEVVTAKEAARKTGLPDILIYGRSSAIADVLGALRRRIAADKGLVIVSGASGSGKSSLARAGVLPKLTAPGVIEGFTAWRRATMIPGDGGDPCLALAHALLETSALPELDCAPAQLAARLAANPAAGVEIIAGALRQIASESRIQERHILETKAAAAQGHGREAEAAKYREVMAQLSAPRAGLALVVDQLEETFTQIEDAGKRARFLELVAALALEGHIVVLATLRADFWPMLVETPCLSSLAQGEGRYDLLAPRPSELEEMITRPVIAAGLTFEAAGEAGDRSLDREILDEAASAPDPLPLLQFSLESLYRHRTPDGVLTRQAWREIGGIEGALRHHADTALSRLPKAVRMAAPNVFRRLVVARIADGGSLGFNRRWVPISGRAAALPDRPDPLVQQPDAAPRLRRQVS